MTRRRAATPSVALWRWPVALAVLSAAGLVLALWGDGAWDWLAWLGLGLPMVLALWFGALRGGPRRR